MRIAIVHNEVKDDGRKDEQDVLIQAEVISKTLEKLGHTFFQVPCGLNLMDLKNRLEALSPDMVFNLVESLGGQDRLIYLVPGLLDAMELPYTGSSAEAIFLTTHKVFAKERMSLAALPTPEWIGPYPTGIPILHHNRPDFRCQNKEWIVKSLWEHGSLGLEENNVVCGKTEEELKDLLKERASMMGGACFAEAFIHGREFNISLLEGPSGPMLLPPAEIIFEDFKIGKPAIVGYQAKWDAGSHEFHHTPRSFDFPEEDQALILNLKTLALRCWNLFGLKGYARVDFRVDEKRKPWILEINTNPCLSPDAGFIASALKAGFGYTDVIEYILADKPETNEPTAPGESPKVVTLRYVPASSDAEGIRTLTESTGFFYPPEVDVAEELVLERLAKGEASGYYFVFAELEGGLVGYTCYGPIPCTISSFDFYWIAVHPDFQGKGLGKVLLNETERLIKEAKGERIYVETSQRPLYDSTRAFYEKCGYHAESVLENFYGPGDGRVTYCKLLI
jgi:D-alanine-D-alanine ligase